MLCAIKIFPSIFFDHFSQVEKSTSKTFGALCCESGPLSMDYVLNKNGFVCGEKIKINIKLDNVSGKVIKEVKAYLTQEVKYHGTYHPPKPEKAKAKKGKKKKFKLNSKRKDTAALKKTKVMPVFVIGGLYKIHAISLIINKGQSHFILPLAN